MVVLEVPQIKSWSFLKHQFQVKHDLVKFHLWEKKQNKNKVQEELQAPSVLIVCRLPVSLL